MKRFLKKIFLCEQCFLKKEIILLIELPLQNCILPILLLALSHDIQSTLNWETVASIFPTVSMNLRKIIFAMLKLFTKNHIRESRLTYSQLSC